MKTKVTIEKEENEDYCFTMSEMEPGQICIIANDRGFNGAIVCRTLSVPDFQVINLSHFETDRCWTSKNDCSDVMVKQAPKGTKIIFEVE